jgi:hypothetical protein
MTNKTLTNGDWTVTGHEIVAWISDTECFDITFDEVGQVFALRINNVASAQTLFLGFTDSLAESLSRANAHLRDDTLPTFVEDVDPNLLPLSCEHGVSLGVHCADCADEHN